MCHIFLCISMLCDLCQRFITYVCGCCVCVLVFMLLVGAGMIGLAYGYKYSRLAVLKGLKPNEPPYVNMPYGQDKLSEMDPSYFKSLRSYYLEIHNTTEAEPTLPDILNNLGIPTGRSGLLQEQDEVHFKNYKLEDDVDRKDLKEDEVAPNRPTVSSLGDKPETAIKDYVKKLNWVVYDDNLLKTTTDKQDNKRGVEMDTVTKRRDDNHRLRYSTKNSDNNKDFHADLKRLSEFSGFPSRKAVPLGPKSKTHRKPTETSDTKDLFDMSKNISNAKTATPISKKSVAMDILQNKLMSLNNDRIVDSNRDLSKITKNAPTKQYRQILDWLLSQKGNMTANTVTEKMYFV